MIELPIGWEQYKEDIIKACGGESNIRQAKEKFGSLRVYHGPENVDRVKLDELERVCSRTCMACGTDKDMYKRMSGWIGPICGKCIKQGK